MARALDADPASSVFLGREASEQWVKTMALDDRRVIAFATHGSVAGDLDGLDQNALALSVPASPADEEDGLLTMEEVLGLSLVADWAILSACNTAAADGRGTEAVSGLGRALFFAGARAILATHWPVETTSAAFPTTTMCQRRSAATPRRRAGTGKALPHR
jgi:CHAT domain-containing protein